MAKKVREKMMPEPRRVARMMVTAHATARRFDGGAVKLEFVLQPEAAAQLTDQVVHALVGNGRRR